MTASNSMTVHNMAEDISQQTLMVNTHVDDDVRLAAESLNTAANRVKDDKRSTSADILQQALDEADGYEQNSLSRTDQRELQENVHHLADHSYIHTSKQPSNVDVDSIDSTTAVGENSKDMELAKLQFIAEGDLATANFTQSGGNSVGIALSCRDVFADETGPHGESLVISENGSELSSDQQFLTEVVLSPTMGLSSDVGATSMTGELLLPVSVSTTGGGLSSMAGKLPISEATIVESSSGISSSPAVGLSSARVDVSHLNLRPKHPDAPVGSFENPIQVLEHQKVYHPTQLLTQAQMQQISHAIQDKKVQNGVKSVLYHPTTKTRLVCRVVYPAELGCQGVVPVGRGKGRPKKGRRDEDVGSLSKEERAEKKKQRATTRSGRISKPPSYMVKDYKRIHHLDFDDEANNSDGGYSDYHVSDEDSDRLAKKSNALMPGVSTSKQRNYPCRACNKAYIGRGGLSRHYRLNPTHGTLPEGEDASTQDENSNSSLASSVLSSSGGNAGTQASVATAVPPHTSRFESECPPQGPAISDDSLSKRRKSKLRELLQCFSESEVLDVFLPKFAAVVPVWEFFVKKCECEGGLQVFEMLKEFEKFLAEMQKMALNCLAPASLEDQGKTIINISSKQIAEALSLETGAYYVKDVSTTSGRTDAPSVLPEPNAKRKRMGSGNVDDVRLPDQILELPLPSDHYSLDLNSSTPSSLSSACLDSPKTNLFFRAEGGSTQRRVDVLRNHTSPLSLLEDPRHLDVAKMSLGLDALAMGTTVNSGHPLSSAVLANNLHGENTSSARKEVTEHCLHEDPIEPCATSSLDAADLGTNGEYQVVQNEALSSKSNEPQSQVLRHLLLPDGQVIAWWSQPEKPELPSNLVILQNTTETPRVPDQHLQNTDTMVDQTPFTT